jgi:hypothetical protein
MYEAGFLESKPENECGTSRGTGVTSESDCHTPKTETRQSLLRGVACSSRFGDGELPGAVVVMFVGVCSHNPA